MILSFWHFLLRYCLCLGYCMRSKITCSGRFKSQQCQQLLTGPPLSQGLHKINQSPDLKRKTRTSTPEIGLKGLSNMLILLIFRGLLFLFLFFFCFCFSLLETTEIYFGSTKMEIFMPLKVPNRSADRAIFHKSASGSHTMVEGYLSSSSKIV